MDSPYRLSLDPPSPTSTLEFVKYLHIIRPPRDHSKEIQLVDGDATGSPITSSPVYGISSRTSPLDSKRKTKTARIVEYPNRTLNGNVERVLAEVEWVGDQKDRIRIASVDYYERPLITTGTGKGLDGGGGGGGWMLLKDAWDHYSVTKDRERFLSKFRGKSGKTYVWMLQGSTKVLREGSRTGPIIAKHIEQGQTGGKLALTATALRDIGDMLYITFLSAEGYRRRRRLQWLNSPGELFGIIPA